MNQPTRAQLEAVLMKHHIVDVTGITPKTGYANNLHLVTGLLDDLLACWTPPSREKLEKLFDHHNYRYRSAEEWRQRFKDAVWVWATSQPERVWCEHLQYEKPGVTLGCRTEGFYICKTKTGINILVDDNWKSCPICAAPRPSEG